MNNQELAFEKLSKLKVGALFMEMGTGKTKIALDLIKSKIHKVNYILWICPFSLKNEIEKEKNKWHPDLVIDIVGCESIGSSDRIYLKILDKVINNDTFIVVDESLKIKNKEAKRTKRILKFGEFAKYKLILNGTPLSKNVLDLYTQIQFLSPKILNMSYNQFKNQYCEYYIHGRLKNLVKKQHNIEHLISLVKPYIFDSKLEIQNKKTYHQEFYEMDDVDEYQELKMQFLTNSDKIDFMALTTILQKHYSNSESKMILIEKLINSINDKVIVFVKYLENIPEDTTAITGDVSLSERKKILKSFEKNEFQTLYITYGCGAYGLNLQFCKNIIFADHTFDYSQRIQAEARIYRIGQNYDVNYYDLVCSCGLEKLIMASLNKKSNLLDEIKKEIEKIGGVDKWLKTI